MKKILVILCFISLAQAFAAIPTEEGLLKNLNNPNPAGKIVTLKMAIKNEFYKFIFLLDKPNVIGLAQITYGDSQMQPSQIKDVKFIQDLPAMLTKEELPERSLFYGTLLMLATNHSVGIEIFLAKNGVKIAKNKNLINEEKMNLLKTYRMYLLSNRGKRESDSPLNPADPEEKAKVLALFKSNTYASPKNIELIKEGPQFFWKADWQSVQGFFTNEERRLKAFTYKNQDTEYLLETNEYTSFNGVNEFPKYIDLKNDKGLIARIQTLGEDVGLKRDFEDLKKKPLPKKDLQEKLSFLY